ncbi:MAG: hypothetical protein NTY09_10585 [bacterium]|nr:hypothetical protein [bacterium]
MRGVQWIVVLAVAFVCAGCNGGGGNPAVPDNPGLNGNPSQITTSQDATGNRYILSLGTVNVSADHQTMEVVPMRTGEMHLNMVTVAEMVGSGGLAINYIEFISPDILKAQLDVHHPLADMDKYTIFDVRVITMTDSDYSFPVNDRKIAWEGPYPIILNPDGYSLLFNPVEFPEGSGPALLRYNKGYYAFGDVPDATLNPFIAYNKDEPRRMFGNAGTCYLLFTAPEGPFSFGYAIDCSWEYVEDPHDPVEDFPPEANCLEPYEINTWVGDGLTAEFGSKAPIYVEVWDHQGIETVEKVQVEAPALFDGTIDLPFSCVNGEESCLFQGIIQNQKGDVSGELPLLVRAVSTESDPNLGQIDAWDITKISLDSESWVRAWGGDGLDYAHGVCTDDEGNLFVTGSYLTQLDLDPGPGVAWYPPVYTWEKDTCYLSKFNSQGDFENVAVFLDAGGNSMGYQVEVDQSGNVYVIGSFHGCVDFDPGPGSYYLGSPSNAGMFICALDSSFGLKWAQAWPFSYVYQYSKKQPVDFVIGDDGNIYMAGNYPGDTDFDPGPGSDVRPGPGMFLMSLDPSGIINWVQTIEGQAFLTYSVSTALLTDNTYVIVAGGFEGTADFDPGPGTMELTSKGYSDAFLWINDTSGVFHNVISWGGTKYDYASTLAIDDIGNIWVAGTFEDTVDFDPGPDEDIISSIGQDDFYLCKYDSEFNYVLCNTWGSNDDETVYGLDVGVDDLGNVYVLGNFYNPVDFDPGSGVDEYTPDCYKFDFFLSKFDSSGDYEKVTVWSGSYSKACTDLDLDPEGNAYISGYYCFYMDFNPGPGIDSRFGDFDGDAFCIRYSSTGIW